MLGVWHSPGHSYVQLHIKILMLMKLISRALIPVLICFAAASCEYEYYPENLSDEGKIYLHCVPEAGSPVEILAAVAYPIIVGDGYVSPSPVLTLKVNGESVALSLDGEHSPKFKGESKYVSDCIVNEGDVVEVYASADGLDAVSSRTVVPEAVPPFVTEVAKVQTDKNPPMQLGTSMDNALKFTLRMNPLEKDSWYGVQVVKRVGFYPEEGMTEPESEETGYSDILVWENEDMISAREEDVWVMYGDGIMQIFDVEAGAEGALEVYVPYMSSEGGIYDVDYNLLIYRMSEEFYRYARSVYMQYLRYGILMAFTHPSHQYTNVVGGVGFVGAIDIYESGYIDNI